MKMYKKSDLTIIDGLLTTKDGDIIMPDRRIIDQANDLETLLQKTCYLKDQPEATPMPSLDGFERISIMDSKVTKFSAKTPTLDKRTDEAMRIMEELDDINVANQANEMLDEYSDLLAFVQNDYVIDCGGSSIVRFDTPVLGSVIEIGAEEVVAAVAMAYGLKKKPCEECDDPDCPKARGAMVKHVSKDDFDKLFEILDSLDGQESEDTDGTEDTEDAKESEDTEE